MTDLDSNEDIIAKFERKVKRNMQIIQSSKVDMDKRVEAAYWLGEAGSPQAISALRKVYLAEKNPKLKSAAEYALGQYKAMDYAIEREPGEAVETALGRPENEIIYQLMLDIALEGKFGKRKRISTSLLVRFQMLLVVLLMILVGLNFVLLSGGSSGGDLLADLPITDRATPALNTLAELDLITQAVTLDAQAIQTGLENRVEGVPANCDHAFEYDYAEFEIYAIDPQVQNNNFEVFVVANQVNAALNQMKPAYDTFTAACSETPPDETAITGAITTAQTVIAGLPDTQTEITSLQDSLQPPPALQPAIVEATPEVTEELVVNTTPTIAPTPTLEPSVIVEQVSALASIVNRVNEPSGAIPLLEQTWQNVQNTSGSDRICRTTTRPTIPDDYVVPEDLAQIIPALAQAQTSINSGLALLRDGWNLFDAACQNNNLLARVNPGLTYVSTATTSFESAREALQGIDIGR